MFEGGSGGVGSVMSGSESVTNSATPTSVSSTVPVNQLVTTTGEEESASTATSATGTFTLKCSFYNKIIFVTVYLKYNFLRLLD